LVNAIHTDGQIWATAMMKIWNDIGRNKADKIFWSGLGMTNSSTNQNDAANAVYQAAINLGYTYTERQAIHTRFTAAGYTLPALPPLPLELTAFGVRKVARTAVLDWTTSNESGTAFFNVERSANGRDFSLIGKQEAAGNSTSERRYTFTDVTPLEGENFYRLQAFDKDGSSTYSPVQVLDFGSRQALVAAPNPTHNFLTVNAEGAVGALNLYDALGRLVLSKSFENADKNTSFTLDLTTLPQGVYSLRLEADGQVSTTKVLKN
jgi:hypothetical protein